MKFSTALSIAAVASMAQSAQADDSDDGFFDRIKILGSSTGQLQKDNASLSGGLGFSGENDHHFLFLLINGGLSQKPPDANAPATAYGQFLLTPPASDVSLTARYRYFHSDKNTAIGAYAQLDAGTGDIAASISGMDHKARGFAIAFDAGATGRIVLSRKRGLYLFGFAGLSSRFLGGDAARDEALKMATIGTTKTAFVGGNASVLLQLGDVFAGVQLSYLSGDVAGLSGAQFIPVAGLRGGFDISAPEPGKRITPVPTTTAPPTPPSPTEPVETPPPEPEPDNTLL